MAIDTPKGLYGLGEMDFEELLTSDWLAWLRAKIGKFVKGGIYLIAGQPGIGKSTLAIQLALDLARSGTRTVYILTEQSKEELARRARLLTSDWPTPMLGRLSNGSSPKTPYTTSTFFRTSFITRS